MAAQKILYFLAFSAALVAASPTPELAKRNSGGTGVKCDSSTANACCNTGSVLGLFTGASCSLRKYTSFDIAWNELWTDLMIVAIGGACSGGATRACCSTQQNVSIFLLWLLR